MEYHPDRNDGCEKKAQVFKDASEAYDTLSDTGKRTIYDREIQYQPKYEYGYVRYQKQTVDQRTAHYRKVYAPRPPPGFKVFDHERHQHMHYGDGIMEEEIERMRIRARRAGSLNMEYESPLGKGFTLNNNHHQNHRSKSQSREQQNGNTWIRTKKGTGGMEYESAYMDGSTFGGARNPLRAKETVLERMQMRRQQRLNRQHSQQNGRRRSNTNTSNHQYNTTAATEEGCSIM